MEDEDAFFECSDGSRPVSVSDVASGPTKVTSTSPAPEDEVADAAAILKETTLEDAEERNEDLVEEQREQQSLEKDIEIALAYKEEGNTYFRMKDYDNACQAYSNAIDHCPASEKEHLATFYGNRAAAYFATDDHELVVDDCGKALELKPDYVKVLARRMQSQESLGKIEEALADAKKIQELDPSYPKIATTLRRLQALFDEKMAKLKDEALGKLKDLGNSILGNFGMSLDNFKMAQDPNTGSWSIR